MKKILESRKFVFIITLLIFYSVICYSIETLPDLPDGAIKFLGISEVIVVFIFSAEYLLRLIYAQNKTKFIFSLYGLIDLVAILPFYFSFSLDLRTLRVVRLMRLFRLLKLIRYDAAFKRIKNAILIAKEELVIFMSAIIILLYLSAFGIYHFEHAAQPDKFVSIFDALWWAVATITTVGYGDIYPITGPGRAFTFLILILGLGLVAIPTGIVASALSAVRVTKLDD